MSSAVSCDSDRAGAADDGGGRAWRSPLRRSEVGEEGVVGLAGDIALEAAHDFRFGLAFGGAALGVGACPVAVAQAADGDQVKRAVGLAVAAEVEAMPGGFAGGGGHR